MSRKVPKMSRGHFILIADTINKYPVKDSEKLFLAEMFADELRATNVNFKRERFVTRATRPHKTPQDYAAEISALNAKMLRKTAKEMRAMVPEVA